MAQLPSSSVPYSFSGRTRIQADAVTVLPYISSVDLGVIDATPTILRYFYDDPPNVKAEPSAVNLDGTAPAPPRSAMRARSTTARTTTPEGQTPGPRFATPAPSTASFASPPPFSPEPTPAPRTRAESDANARSASVPTINFAGAGRKGPTVITRSASRSSLSGGTPIVVDAASTSASAASTSASTSVSAASTLDARARKAKNRQGPPEEFDEDGSRTSRERQVCQPNDNEKRTGTRSETAWFPSKADYALSAPPAWVTKRSDLIIGDLFCHWTPMFAEPQMWIWVADANGPTWKSVTKGYVRPHDKRMLTINNENEPRFITEGWNRKQIRKRAAEAAAAEIARKRDKGKSRGQ